MDFRRLFSNPQAGTRRLNGSPARTVIEFVILPLAIVAFVSTHAWAWPSTAEPSVWQDLSLIYSLLGGAAFLLSAVLIWMVWSRRFGMRTERPAKTSGDFWAKLVSVTARAGTFDQLLSSSMHIVAESLAADRAMVVKYSQREGRLYLVEAAGLSDVERNDLIGPATAATIFHSSIFGGRAVVVTSKAAHKKSDRIPDRYWLTIPIVNHYQVLAVLALSSRAIQPDNTSLLKTAASLRDFLSQVATGFLAAAVSEIRRDATYKAEMLAKELAACRGVEQALGKIADVVRQLIPLDLISISRFDPKSENVVRWSALIDGGKLVERQYPILYGGSETARLAGKSLRPTVEDDLLELPQAADSLEARRGMRSRLTVPIVHGGKYLAGLTIAHRECRAFDDTSLAKLDSIARVLGGWLQVKDTEVVAARLDRYLDVINRLDHLDEIGKEEVIGMLRRAMNVSMLRLFRYDPGEKSLLLAASAAARPMGQDDHPIMPTPAERMPWHRYALQSRRPCLIDQSDPERLMSPEESKLALVDNFKTGLLMPVYREGETLGILSAVEMRHPARRRFEGADYIFMRSAASRMAGLLGGGTHRALPKPDRFMSPDIMPMLATPLTTIYGSVDLIRQSHNDIDNQTARYLGNIERAAERIKTTAWECDTRTANEQHNNGQLNIINV